MAALLIIKCLLPLLMLMGSCYCATYSFGGTFGFESHLNLTSTFGTMNSNDTEKSGLGGTWKGIVYGGGYGSSNNISAGVVASATKEASLKPGDSLGDIKVNDTAYRGQFFFGENARRNEKSIRNGDQSLIRGSSATVAPVAKGSTMLPNALYYEDD